MKERSIIFGPESVLAILNGRKTQTRRVVKPQPEVGIEWASASAIVDQGITDPCWLADGERIVRCPFGSAGALLWVREAWASPQEDIVAYRASGECGAWMGDGEGGRIWINHGWIHGATDGNQPGKWFGLGKYGGGEPGSGWVDVSDDVAAVLEHELGGRFTGDGWRRWEEDVK